jgi:hypothetical protein
MNSSQIPKYLCFNQNTQVIWDGGSTLKQFFFQIGDLKNTFSPLGVRDVLGIWFDLLHGLISLYTIFNDQDFFFQARDLIP